MALNTTYQPAGSSCSGGPTAGAQALMAWFLGAYGKRGGRNLGIYNCRTIDGTEVPSLHGEGRAGDLGCNATNADQRAWGWQLARALVANSKALGVQLVIWDRKVWSAAHPRSGWRAYRGRNPHRDHLHVELTKAAAGTLTAAKIQATIGGPAPAPAPSWTEAIVKTFPTLRRGAAQRAHVALLQALLNMAANGRHSLAEDGHFGDKTLHAVQRFQVAHRVPNSVAKGRGDGIVGRQTWTALLDV